jgi:hypothetical protein
MKLLLLAALAAATLTAGFAATRIQTSLVLPPRDQVSLEILKQLPHPWTKSQPLPVTLADSGLLPDARVVHTAFYLDGGSRFFALRDSAGACLFFCTSKPYSQAKHDGDTDWQQHFILGATNYRDSAGVPVPRGSPTELLLLKAVNGRIVSVAAPPEPPELPFGPITTAPLRLTLKEVASGQREVSSARRTAADSTGPLATFSRAETRSAPFPTPSLATERFPAALHTATTHATTVEVRTPSPLAAPVAAGDLIGRASDLDKMLEDHRRRTSAPSTSPERAGPPKPAIQSDAAPAARPP